MVNHSAVAIPEKLFFKIGEVCDIAGVQAHVLRYWESEFSMLAPQKNRAGQRTYRKRDVEMALRIKDLLYEEQYTIAGAKKKLQSEVRGGAKLKVVAPEVPKSTPPPSPLKRVAPSEETVGRPVLTGSSKQNLSEDDRAAIRDLASQLKELLFMIETDGGD